MKWRRISCTLCTNLLSCTNLHTGPNERLINLCVKTSSCPDILNWVKKGTFGPRSRLKMPSPEARGLKSGISWRPRAWWHCSLTGSHACHVTWLRHRIQLQCPEYTDALQCLLPGQIAQANLCRVSSILWSKSEALFALTRSSRQVLLTSLLASCFVLA